MLAGSPDIDAVSDSIDEATFQRWMAAEELGMFGHTEKMLGFIAFILANYVGMKFDSGDDLRQITMPWSKPEEANGAAAFQSIKKQYERAVE